MGLNWILRICFALLICATALPAQTPAAPEAAPPSAQDDLPDKKKTLSSLLVTRDNLNKSLDEQRKRLKAEATESGKEDAQQQIDRLEKRRQEVDRDFNVMVTGVQSLEDYSTEGAKQEPVKLQDELGQLLLPIFTDLRELTRKPREVRALQDERTRLDAQESQAQQALTDIEKLLAELKASKDPDQKLRAELLDKRTSWQTNLEEVGNRIAVVQHQLNELNAAGGNFWSEMGQQVKDFVFIRGTNVALALLAFFVVLFGLRSAYYYTLKLVPVRRYEKLSFSARILDVVHEGGSLVLGVVAGLLVLYARGDWLLGGLVLLALGGLLMTAKSGVGKLMANLQILLNLGSVREGERVYINGVPWRVGPIHMFTQLTNIVIGGPGLRLPLDMLSTMTSRPSMLDEPWFPCAKRAWIVLNGDMMAQVTDITPDRVGLSYGGGLVRWMPIADFVQADVACLAGGFGRAVTVGFDYKHQAEALTEIPEKLKEDVRATLLEMMREEELVNVIVEFQEAAASSLNFVVVGVFTGSQATNYVGLPRVLQRAVLASANRHGWGIPFPQMVVHQAAN